MYKYSIWDVSIIINDWCFHSCMQHLLESSHCMLEWIHPRLILHLSGDDRGSWEHAGLICTHQWDTATAHLSNRSGNNGKGGPLHFGHNMSKCDVIRVYIALPAASTEL